jgi:hypothetical protein
MLGNNTRFVFYIKIKPAPQTLKNDQSDVQLSKRICINSTDIIYFTTLFGPNIVIVGFAFGDQRSERVLPHQRPDGTEFTSIVTMFRNHQFANFELEEPAIGYFRCRCSTIRQQTPTTGYSNLIQHVRKQHPDFEELMRSATTAESQTLAPWL